MRDNRQNRAGYSYDASPLAFSLDLTHEKHASLLKTSYFVEK